MEVKRRYLRLCRTERCGKNNDAAHYFRAFKERRRRSVAGRRADDKNILKQKSLIGFVPDFFGVYENLNVIEYLEFFAASYGIYGRAGTVRAREVLEMVELSGKEEQMVDSLSRGIQQRLCLARDDP